MPWTIAAQDPATGARGLLAEVHPEWTTVSAVAFQAFCRRLFQRSVRVGLVVTPSVVIVVRDGLSSVQRRSAPRHELATDLLFAHAGVGAPRHGEAFVQQVVTWLEAIGSSWYSFLHPTAVSVMVPDVVGHLVSAQLEVSDGVLVAHDAAE